ncbi:MAG: YdcF family protein [Candidatus Rokubacteria bacterium]|nr:YdcF family protein [Candidatus Rokubacteria bacterium]
MRLAAYLSVEDRLERADAIFVFAGGFPARVLAAAELFRNGYGRVLVVDRDTVPPGFERLRALGVEISTPSEMERHVAVQLGVPGGSVEVLPRASRNTEDGVRQLLTLAEQRNLRTIILVSSKFHTRRIRLMFDAHSEGKARGIVYGTPYDSFDPQDWWRRRDDVRRVVFEYQKLLNWWLVGY